MRTSANAATVLAVTMVLSGCSKKDTGCKKDTECKGDRICVKGQCQAPGASKPEDQAQGQTKGQTPSPHGPFGLVAPPPPPPPPPGGSGGSGGPAVPLPPSGQALSLKICVDNKCVDLGQKARQGPGAIFDLMDLFSQIFQSGFLGAGPPFPFFGPGGKGKPAKKRNIKICINGKCVKLDRGLTSRPQDLQRLFRLLQKALGQSMGFGGSFQWGLPGGRSRKRFRYWRHHAPFSPPGRNIAKDPPGKITYRSLKPLRKAGPDAVGRVAELKGLAITTVRDHELVLQGKGRLLLVLSVPPHLKHLIKGLRTRTTKVTARFHVTEPVAGNLVRGELLNVK